VSSLLPEIFQERPHRRFNPLTRQWVLVSPHRAKRPWLGQVEKRTIAAGQPYDPKCYLCPGNERAGGVRNPQYKSTFVFDNDFSALLPDTPVKSLNERDLLVAQTEPGICRVVCFSPDHSLSVPRLPKHAMVKVIETWNEEYVTLGAIPWIRSVQIFENRGEMMGASNPHPHCQIWANASIPDELAREVDSQEAYHREKGSCLLCDYVRLELQLESRVVAQNAAFAAVVPFWAVWPFETLVVSKDHFTSISDADAVLLADILQRITTRYDNLFETPFPYTMGFHQRPTDGGEHGSFHFHAHFYPPLLRSATVRKFMVGYEMLANAQRDITPEGAAERLRSLSETHYQDQV